ncbi:MAG: RlmE family RNA methyltransferase [Thaumarchaeota archaeon]|nr:RlmE family RNA methyltransferase [Nitrososphaerota archaeon]
MRLEEAKYELYRRLAKERGYRSRAAFKLMEINRSYHIIRRGMYIVDLGCAPGGWLQVGRKFVGGYGKVLGVDIHPVEPLLNVQIIKGDVNDTSLVEKIHELMGRNVNLVLSDIAPNITGAWQLDHIKQLSMTENAVTIAYKILTRNGNGVFKAFEGNMLNELRDRLKVKFNNVRFYKPRASRKASSEIYLVCLGYKGSE